MELVQVLSIIGLKHMDILYTSLISYEWKSWYLLKSCYIMNTANAKPLEYCTYIIYSLKFVTDMPVPTPIPNKSSPYTHAYIQRLYIYTYVLPNFLMYVCRYALCMYSRISLWHAVVLTEHFTDDFMSPSMTTKQ